MIFDYGALRPPIIRGIRAQLTYLDLTPDAAGRKETVDDDTRRG
jgi:hypothetical protein